MDAYPVSNLFVRDLLSDLRDLTCHFMAGDYGNRDPGDPA
jgi:hypothetical protein